MDLPRASICRVCHRDPLSSALIDVRAPPFCPDAGLFYYPSLKEFMARLLFSIKPVLSGIIFFAGSYYFHASLFLGVTFCSFPNLWNWMWNGLMQGPPPFGGDPGASFPGRVPPGTSVFPLNALPSRVPSGLAFAMGLTLRGPSRS